MTRSFAAFALAGSVLAAPASAQMTAEIVEATLLEGWRTEDGSHMTALSLTLAPGWKTYWRAPGDAGIPPYFDWSGSENLGAVRLHWPVPEVYFINGMRSIGYETAVMIPMEIEPKAATEPIRIASDVTLGVCEEICIPVTLRLDAVLAPDSGVAPDARIAAALRDRPMTESEARVGSVICTVAPIDDGVRVTISAVLPSLGGSEHAAVELRDRTVWIAEPSLTRNGNEIRVETEMVPPEARPFGLARDDVRITVFGESGAVDIRGCSAS